MRRPRGTDGSLLSSLPWTLGALALALSTHLPYLPVWITAAFFGCGLTRYLIERRRAALPAAWLRALLALGCFLGVLATYSTISGVGPGSALLAVMASLKLLETRQRRDQFVLLFIAIFLVMASLLREQYLWSLPYLLLSLFVIMAAWLRMSADPQERVASSFRTGGRLLLYAAPLAAAMWIFFPRISTPFWAVPIDTSSGVSGLSDTMSPGDISSLSMSNEVAFRARFLSAVPAPRDRYWRAMVLHRFNGRSWTGFEPTRDPRALQRIKVRGEPVRYQVTMEPTRQHWVPVLEMPIRWNLSRAQMGRMQELTRVYPIDQRIAFEVDSYTDYRVEADIGEYVQSWYLSLPPRSNPRTVALARRLRAEAPAKSDFVNAVLAMFNEQAFFYTLQPPALGDNPVDRFLFETRRGFCEHYASAFTVMMRAAGIPARVVLGYQGGEINPMGEYMIVRQSDAHAWAEIWLDGHGWRRVDPTAAVAPERIEMGFTSSLFDGIGAEWGIAAPSALLHRLRLTWDAINTSWNEWILGYGPDRQESLMQRLGMDDPSWRQMMLTLIAVVVVLILVVSVMLMLRYRPPPRDRAAVLYERFVKKAGLVPRIGETPLEYAARATTETTLGAEQIYAVTNAYLDARYGIGGAPALGQLQNQVAALR